MHRVLIRGTINLLLANLRITVITNLLQGLVRVFTPKLTKSKSNTVTAIAYVDGKSHQIDIAGVNNNHKGTLEFSNLPKGAKV